MFSRPWLLLDAVAALAVTAVYGIFAGFDGSDGSPAFPGPPGLGWLVAAAVGLPLAVRRLWPVPVLAIVVGGEVAAALLDITREPNLAAGLALYAVGVLEPRRRWGPVLVGALLALVAAVVLGSYVITPSETATGTGVLAMLTGLVGGGGCALGVAVRSRRQALGAMAASDRRRAATDERLRIAREIHDVVSHSLSLIAVQASVANHVVADEPDAAAAALRSIEDTSRRALADMRAVLGILREDPVTDREQAGVAELGALVEQARKAGVEISLAVALAQPLPSSVDRTVYRIVQEGLTNVVRHAGADRCEIRVTASPDRVRVDVTDDGRGASIGQPRNPGFGLVGVRERVLAQGGEFAAGPIPDGGYALRAELPYAAGDLP